MFRKDSTPPLAPEDRRKKTEIPNQARSGQGSEPRQRTTNRCESPATACARNTKTVSCGAATRRGCSGIFLRCLLPTHAAILVAILATKKVCFNRMECPVPGYFFRIHRPCSERSATKEKPEAVGSLHRVVGVAGAAHRGIARDKRPADQPLSGSGFLLAHRAPEPLGRVKLFPRVPCGIASDKDCP